MKKLLAIILVASSIFVSGCTTNKATEPTVTPSPTPLAFLQPKEFHNLYLKDWIRWDMNLNEVKDLEDRKIDSTINGDGKRDEFSFVYVKPSVVDYFQFAFDYVYTFDDLKLKSYIVKYDGSDPIDDYEMLKEKMTEKYGGPVVNEINWTDETYKENKEKWADAMKYGYVSMYTKWELPDDVVAILCFDDENKFLGYCKADYEDTLYKRNK